MYKGNLTPSSWASTSSRMHRVEGVPSIFGLAIVVLAMILAAWIGAQVGEGGVDGILRAMPLVVAGIAGVAILLRPYLGVVFFLVGLLLEEALPSVPLLTSAFQLIGAATVGAYFFHVLNLRRMSQLKPQLQHILGVGFIVWFFLSQPEAAVLSGERNWLLTYVQLWVLMWLTGQLINDSTRQRFLIGAYIAGIVISAVLAVQAGGIGESVGASYQASAMMAGVNEAARRFVVGIVLSVYLLETAVSPRARLAAYISIGLTFLGVVFTVSRSGFLLSLIAVSLIILFRTQSKASISRWSTILVLVGVSLFLVPDQYWQIMGFQLFSTIVEGSGTLGIRYAFWDAGFRMWADHPLTGVGIGQFSANLPRYGLDLLPFSKLENGAHSLYFGLLAETGIIGLGLFISLVACAGVALWRIMNSRNVEVAMLARTWLIVLILILVGGIAKHDQYDKLLWLVLGMSVALSPRTFITAVARNRSLSFMPPGAAKGQEGLR